MSRTRQLIFLIVSTLILSLTLVGVPTDKAFANDPPVWDTSDISPQDMRVHGDGSVTITDCNTYVQQTDASIVYAAKTFSSSGEVLNQIPKETSDSWATLSCRQTSTVGTDGTFFVSQKNGGSTNTRIAAYKNGAIRWSRNYECSSGQDLRPEAMVLGRDGNIYAVFYNPSNPQYCLEHPDGERVLIGISSVDGSELFRHDIPIQGVGIEALDDKLVVWTSKDILFFSYSDTALDDQDLQADPAYGNYFWVNQAGQDTVLYTYQRPQSPSEPITPCPQSSGNYSLTFYMKQGDAPPVDLNVGSKRCIIDAEILPDNSIVYAYRDTSTGHVNLLRRDVAGNIFFDTPITSLPGYGVYKQFSDAGPEKDWVTVNGAGEIYLKRRIYIPNNSGADINLRIDKVSATGTFTEVFNTSTVNDPNAKDWNFPMQAANGGLGGDRLYIPVCNFQSCHYGASSSVIVADLNAGFDYPRSEIFADYEQLNYVALGDSFSSGEGVEPFYEATDISPDVNPVNPNLCHRSKKAYPEVLHNTPGASLALAQSVACSGATTSEIINASLWGEPPQSDELSTDIDVVTLTVGGNDVSFAPTITRCVLDWLGTPDPSADCDDAISASEAQVDVVGVLIQNALEAIEDEIGPNTKVYVMGYPQILPQTINQTSFGLPCSAWNFTSQQVGKIWAITNDLNDAIELNVENMDSNFEFVDPRDEFQNHTVCDSDSYLNDIHYLDDQEYSYHPNEQGQKALARVLLKAMKTE